MGVLGLSAFACGGDDDDATKDDSSSQGGNKGGGGDRQKLIDALSGTSDSSDEFTKDEISCMVPGMVDAIGVEKLIKAGALENPNANFEDLGLDLTDDQAGQLFDAMNDCVDLRDAFVKGASGDGTTTAEQAQCLSDNIDDDTFRAMMVTAFTEGQEAMSNDAAFTAAIQTAATKCITP